MAVKRTIPVLAVLWALDGLFTMHNHYYEPQSTTIGFWQIVGPSTHINEDARMGVDMRLFLE